MNTHIDGVDISAFLDGALAVEDRARVDAHLTVCSGCRREFEALRHMKLVLAASPRKTLPAELALSLEGRFVAAPSPWKVLVKPSFWMPVGAVAAAALSVGLWIHQTRAADELPLEPLLAAHERYSAESLIPQEHLIASAYSDQLTALYADAPDSEPE